MKKRFKFFIGFDISKLTLDVAVNLGTENIMRTKVANTPTEIGQFYAQISSIAGVTRANTLFGMEHTGIYASHLKDLLIGKRANFVVENPAHIKRSMGLVRGKNDQMDAMRIALFLYRGQDSLRLYRPRRPVVQELAILLSIRDRLLVIKTSLQRQGKEDRAFRNKQMAKKNLSGFANTLSALELDLSEATDRIRAAYRSDSGLKRLMEIATSVPAIGELTALQLIISSNEFLDIPTARKMACYAGLAPFPRQSGTSLLLANRISQIANKKLKALLHLCALNAVRNDPFLKAYYQRKTIVQGKAKLLVINAVRDKLVHRVYACIKRGQPYRAALPGETGTPPDGSTAGDTMGNFGHPAPQ